MPMLVASLTATASSAHAAGSIEGTWSYGGGRVLVTSTGPDEYQGTVVRQIKSAPCRHKTGDVIWTINETGETDVYRGGHTFRDPAGCAIVANRGFARWILSETTAELCFVPPDDEQSPPTCETIQRLAGSARRASFANTVVLPSNKRCRGRRTLNIRLRQPRSDAIVSAQVSVDGKRSMTVARSRINAPITLFGLRKRRYTVHITLRTATKQTIRGSRRYRSCG